MIERVKTDLSENSYIFKVMGDEYLIRGRDTPEYMEEVAIYIEGIINSVAAGNPKLNKSQISVLAALKIADELHKMRQQYQYLEDLLEKAR